MASREETPPEFMLQSVPKDGLNADETSEHFHVSTQVWAVLGPGHLGYFQHLKA